MKILLVFLLGVLALNAVVILFITAILIVDHIKARRRRTQS